MSKRRRKNAAMAGAAALRQRPEWNPEAVLAGRPAAAEQLRDLSAAQNTGAAYDGTQGVCDACAAARAASGDDTTLCRAHLAAALGFG